MVIHLLKDLVAFMACYSDLMADICLHERRTHLKSWIIKLIISFRQKEILLIESLELMEVKEVDIIL